eukprot:474769_1
MEEMKKENEHNIKQAKISSDAAKLAQDKCEEMSKNCSETHSKLQQLEKRHSKANEIIEDLVEQNNYFQTTEKMLRELIKECGEKGIDFSFFKKYQSFEFVNYKSPPVHEYESDMDEDDDDIDDNDDDDDDGDESNTNLQSQTQETETQQPQQTQIDMDDIQTESQQQQEQIELEGNWNLDQMIKGISEQDQKDFFSQFD